MDRYVPYSKRRRHALEQGKILKYQYDTVPLELRTQVVLHLADGLGRRVETNSYIEEATADRRLWDHVRDVLTKEVGVFRLHEEGRTSLDEVANFLMTAKTDHFIDAMEVALRLVNTVARRLSADDRNYSSISETADETIGVINYRCQEHRFGYAFVPEANAIVRIDSEYLHKDVVARAFALLHDVNFVGAANEFAEAQSEYRAGQTKNAITKALNAFESTLKTIFDREGWSYDSKSQAKGLIKVALDHGLIGTPQESFFGALRAILESGVPTLRNSSTASHGQGTAIVSVPAHVAGFALHLTASSIVFLVESFRAQKR